MRNKRLASLLLLTVLFCIGPVSAMGGKFGLGIILGEPTGISCKYWLSQKQALAGGLAYSLMRNDYIYLHGDYLFLHGVVPINPGFQNLLYYVGVGGRIVFKHDPDVGVRVPLGLEFLISDMADIFLELVPVLNLVSRTSFDLDAGLGFRFFF